MMNPELNKFQRVDYDEIKELFIREDGSPVPTDWPVFQLNEKLSLRGYIWKVVKIRRKTLVLRGIGLDSGSMNENQDVK